jgi:hypothetical protein
MMSAIALQAKNNGELVYGYRQGAAEYNYKDIGPWGKVRNGYCAALSMKWIALRLQNKDLAYSENTRLAEKEDWRITRMHNLTKMSAEGFGYDFVMKELGIQRGVPVSLNGAPSALNVTNKISANTGTYMIQYKRSGGGHMAAIHNSGRGIHYFDANHGHFAFKNASRFQNWYTRFLNDSGYSSRYTVKTIVTPVTWISGGGVAALRQRFGG